MDNTDDPISKCSDSGSKPTPTTWQSAKYTKLKYFMQTPRKAVSEDCDSKSGAFTATVPDVTVALRNDNCGWNICALPHHGHPSR